MPFTPEELAELAAFDAEIDESDELDYEELVASNRRDRSVKLDRLDNKGRKIAERNKAYREANREQIAEYHKAYREANREQIAERNKAYREANREQIAEYHKAYYEANREQIAEYHKAYREANREQINKKRRERYAKSRGRLCGTCG